MTEYIDKGIAINIIDMTDHTGYSIECVKDITDLAVKAIKELPAADVVEVVHGKWIISDKNSEKPWKCSKCGYQPVHYDTQIKPFERYCGDCGAKMDGAE